MSCAILRSARRVIILNGFGMTLGDSVIGLTALKTAHAKGVLGNHKPILVRKPLWGRLLVNELYRVAHPLAEIVWFPYRSRLRRCERRIDIREFAFDPGFRGVAMIDFFLTRLGVDPGAICRADKRNLWLASLLPAGRPRCLPPRYVLVCPNAASALRTMPRQFHARILDDLLALQDLPVVTQGRPPTPDRRLHYCPAVGSLAELGGLISGATLVVSTDTAMVHLADAWSVPTLAFFVTHRPLWRVRDYPFCQAIHLPAGLPAALEFPRGEADLVAAREAWSRPGGDLAWLTPVLGNALRTADAWHAA